ncbi:MAG TPA: uridine diphosphate-N-acetylglucosamine-binding protein YvcK [Candidatus Paceibacterota bacterium]|nr:uridine diphosphate-N-acetylglucosamine-binding protein YvcK [Candidatus Paceibacterota bacterium]
MQSSITPKKIVTIGGGTGSFMVLSGLKKYNFNLTAIVSMSDDGGSTGILRDELGVLPPGDLRQCLVALSDSPDIMRKVFNYRFTNGSLEGHNLGNLLLSAMEKITGSSQQGLKEIGTILKIKGKVMPVSLEPSNLKIDLKNGLTLLGEDKINHNYALDTIGINKISLEPKPTANPEAIQAILEADVIILGPGNLYCSLLPNLLVPKISEAIFKSHAKIIYVANLVNKRGHTSNFSLDSYIQCLQKYLNNRKIDFVISNIQKPSAALLKKYQKEGDEWLEIKCAQNENLHPRHYPTIVQANLLKNTFYKPAAGDRISNTRSLIRHDSDKLAKLINLIVEWADNPKILKQIL